MRKTWAAFLATTPAFSLRIRRARSGALAGLVAIVILATAAGAAPYSPTGTTERASIASDGTQANNGADEQAAISVDDPYLPSTTAPHPGQTTDAEITNGTAGGEDPLCGAVQVPLVCVSQSWVARYDGPPGGADWGSAMGTSPDGSTVYVTGYSQGDGTNYDYATVAYDTGSGDQLWVARYNGPAGGGFDITTALGVSPDGKRVFVTGYSVGIGTGNDYATVAYDARSGDQLWFARYSGDGAGQDRAFALGVSPDGIRVFVTGRSFGVDTGQDYATVAYDAATGSEEWIARYNAPGGDASSSVGDSASALGVSPDGNRVFVTGASIGGDTGFDYATVAYSATDGSPLWDTRYNGPANGSDLASALGVSPDGNRVYVTGRSPRVGPFDIDDYDYTTLAIDSADGTQIWAARYDGPLVPPRRVGPFADHAHALDVSPDGNSVYVTGQSPSDGTNHDYATVAYDASGGNQLWAVRYAGPGNSYDSASGLGVSPDGSTVFVTGDSIGVATSYDYATLGYAAATGTELWVARYDGPTSQADVDTALSVSPDGSRLFVTGRSGADYGTVAYDLKSPAAPRPTPTETPTPTPTPTDSPSPSESPRPSLTEVSFTEDSAQSGQYSDETVFEARLGDSNGDPLGGRELSFELVGAESTRSFTSTTDQDGVAYVTPTLEEKPGPHQLTVRFGGDQEHARDAETMSFVVANEDSDLELSVHGEDDDKTLKARLSDLDRSSAGIPERAIDFYSDGELVESRVTDADGVASVALPPSHRGNNRSYKAVFEGDDFYLGSSQERPGKGQSSSGDGSGNGRWAEASYYAGKLLLLM